MLKLLIVGFVVWLSVFTFRVIQIGGIDPTYRDPKTTVLEHFLNSLAEIISQSLPAPQSAILSGIVLGVQETIPFSLRQQLVATSTIHIVVVSGQNLTILAGFLLNLAGYLGRKKVLFLSLFVIVFYSLLTGLQVPVIRAAIMVTLATLAQILGKERTGWWVLSMTGGAMLLYNPNWLLNISFQLSFLATFGVVIVAPIVIKKLKWVPMILREDLGVTISAQALVMPILAYNFGQISLTAIVVNSLILWTVPFTMVSGFLTVFVGFVNNISGQIMGVVPTVLLTYFIDIVEFFAKIPGGSIKIGETGIIMWVGYYLILFAIIWMFGKSWKLKVQS